MKSRRPNRIAELRKLRGLSQAQLAEKVDAHWVTVSRLERGELQLNEEWLDRLSSALNYPRSHIINWDAPKNTVYLAGEITNGTAIHIYGAQKEFELPFRPDDDAVTSWMVVKDDAGWPFLKKDDLLRFFHVQENQIANYLNRLCLTFELPDGSGNVGFIEKGSGTDTYNIRPFIGRTLENIKIDRLWICAEIRFSMPWPTEV